MLLWLNGRIAGISSIMSGLFTTAGANRHWRIAFLSGLLIGTALSQALAGVVLMPRQDYSNWLIIGGGLLVGIGTRVGSGCTSGHGICGIALFSKRSIVATAIFMACGLATIFVLRHLLSVSS